MSSRKKVFVTYTSLFYLPRVIVSQVTAKAVSSNRSTTASEKRRSQGDRRSGDFSNWDVETVSQLISVLECQLIMQCDSKHFGLTGGIFVNNSVHPC